VLASGLIDMAIASTSNLGPQHQLRTASQRDCTAWRAVQTTQGQT
jgi:hypothetical protein